MLYDLDGPNDPEQTTVAGILIEYLQSEMLALVAVDIGFALEIINHGFE
jgi:hypothetical protein